MTSDSKKLVENVLEEIIHPETGKNLAESAMVESIAISDDRIAVTLVFPKSRDPFINSIKRQVKEGLVAVFPGMGDKISVVVKEGVSKTATAKEPAFGKSSTDKIKVILAIASGKGGVGKSTVTANLAITLTSMGYRVGILDADIYGPSQPKMFGIENYEPTAQKTDGREVIIPAEKTGIKIMSIGFFINPSDALVWRGPMATGALKQLIHQTAWGVLDFLLIDLPPGTGDVHLTVLSEINVNGAIIVSTPQQVAIADVRRGIKMFRSPGIEVPIIGIIENMAWFTPAELPENKYYLFGRGGTAGLAEEENASFLGEIPIIQSVMEGAERGEPAAGASPEIEKYYCRVAQNIVHNLK